MGYELTELSRGLVLGVVLTLFSFLVYSLLQTSTLAGVIIDKDTWEILQELKDENAIVEVCSTPFNEPNNVTCSQKLHPFAGFWINDIYNTCTYFLPDGNLFFDGYCYSTLEEPNKAIEACITGCKLGVPYGEDESECRELCENADAFNGEFD